MARGSSGVRHLELTFTMSGVYNLSGASRVRVSDLFSFNIIFNLFRVPGTVELMVLCEIAPFMYASRSPKSILDIIINSFFYFYSLSLMFIWNCLLYLSYRPKSVTFACSRSLHSMFFFLSTTTNFALCSWCIRGLRFLAGQTCSSTRGRYPLRASTLKQLMLASGNSNQSGLYRKKVSESWRFLSIALFDPLILYDVWLL